MTDGRPTASRSHAGTDALDPETIRRQRLEQAIRQAIRVLEETKRSFKSKRLGELRQQLAAMLNE